MKKVWKRCSYCDKDVLEKWQYRYHSPKRRKSGVSRLFITGMHQGDIRWNEKEQYYEDRYYECEHCGTKAGFAYPRLNKKKKV